MALSPAEFILRFLIQVLPSGFHRIRHYGLLAKAPNTLPLDRLRVLILDWATQLAAMPEQVPEGLGLKAASALTCRCCGGGLRIIKVIGAATRSARAPLAPPGVTAHDRRHDHRPRSRPPSPVGVGARLIAPHLRRRLRRRPAAANLADAPRQRPQCWSVILTELAIQPKSTAVSISAVTAIAIA